MRESVCEREMHIMLAESGGKKDNHKAVNLSHMKVKRGSGFIFFISRGSPVEGIESGYELDG